MSGPADIVVVQYPRGATALVWVDLSTGRVMTNHAGLQVTLRQGVKNWAGQVVRPHDGALLLSAVYDHFSLGGYPVHWLGASGLKGVQNTYRV
jgi:hypothetical protein